MIVIPEPEHSRTILRTTTSPPGPIMRGAGTVNYVCGHCQFRLAEGLDRAGQLVNLVLICPRCSAYNETRT